MGAGSSLPSRDTLTSETIKTKNILNGVLDFMLKKSDLLDMYALASSKRCDDYTIFTAKSLDKFFKKIRVTPTEREDGTFYFQDLYTLKRLSGETGKLHTENCLKLSRFFIRILHVFASLSLTIIDMEIPSSNYELNSIGKKVSSANKNRISNENVMSIPYFKRPQMGGVIPQMEKYRSIYVSEAPYDILNKYLNFNSRYNAYSFDNYPAIMIDFDSLKPREGSPVNPSFVYRDTLTINDKQKTVNLEGTFNLDIHPEEKNALILKFAIVRPSEYSRIKEDTFRLTGRQHLWNNQTIPEYIMKNIERAIGKKTNSTNSKRITRRLNLGKLNIKDDFKVTGILDTLDTPPKAYCVARAIQLLSPDSIFYSNKTVARTQICDPKFSLLGKGSLPKMGEALTTSPSIMSLNLLFFDKLSESVPIISEELKRSKYADFVKAMQAVYEEKIETVNNTDPKLITVKNKLNPVCLTRSGSITVTDPNAINSLRSAAANLLSKQLQHVNKAINILKKLFVITPTAPIYLQPLIETGGIDAIERVAAEARDLLIDYYSSCEVTYRDAVQDLKERADKNSTILKIDPK